MCQGNNNNNPSEVGSKTKHTMKKEIKQLVKEKKGMGNLIM